MAVMTNDQVRASLREEVPEQWAIMLNVMSMRIDSGEFTKFRTLKGFVIGRVAHGGLQMSLEQAKSLLEYNPAYAHIAKKLCAKMGIAELAKGVAPVNDKPGPIIGDKSETITNCSDTGRGTSATYRIAKLKRDHPDVAERLEAGEFKNVAEAERAAGCGPATLTRVQRVMRAFERLSEDEQAEALEIITRTKKPRWEKPSFKIIKKGD